MTKDTVLALLKENTDEYVSGSQIAQKLGISRTAIWKSISSLKEEGYIIDSVTNRGYRLSSCSDVLSAENLRKYLSPGIAAEVYPCVTSTNTVLKEMAEKGAPEGTLVAAAEQTGGKGRMGRSFYSPSGSGIYMSLLLRPDMPAGEALKITACAAVSVAEAVEKLSGRRTGIKWVNDVQIDGRKICGILTEASLNCENGAFNYAVLGIGINLCPPVGDYPEEIRGIAGSVFEYYGLIPDLRGRVAAEVVNRFMEYYRRLRDNGFYDGYISRSTVLDKDIRIIGAGRPDEYGHVEDIDGEYALVVRMADGSTRRISSGEVSIRTV